MIAWAIAVLLLIGSIGQSAFAQETVDYFKQNCVSCHTIGGGRLVGPDLKDVSTRADRQWLIDFLIDPNSKLDSNDAYAAQILSESRGVKMPPVAGLDQQRAAYLIDLIDAESAKEKSQFAGLQLSDRPFTAEDVAAGQAIFIGTQRLTNNGPACFGCHTTKGLGFLGGGRLGPDLTKVFERQGGRNSLAQWLSGPATSTMRSVFTDHPMESEEVLALTAYFAETAKAESDDSSVASLNFFLIGFGGAIFMLLAFDGIWRKRFRAVRRPLVTSS